MYVLKAKPDERRFEISDGYFTGETYIFQGEKYAVVDIEIDKAKKYTSLKRAENAAERMFCTIVNYVFDVEEFKELEYELD